MTLISPTVSKSLLKFVLLHAGRILTVVDYG